MEQKIKELSLLFKKSFLEIKKVFSKWPKKDSLRTYTENLLDEGKLKYTKDLNDYIFQKTDLNEFIKINRQPGMMVPSYFILPSLSLVFDYLTKYDTFSFNQKKSNLLIKNFLSSVESKKSSVRHISPILGFRSTESTYRINPNLCIKKVTEKDLEFYSNIFPKFKEENENGNNQYIIEFEEKDLTIEQQHNHNFVSSVFESVLDSLRTIQVARVECRYIYTLPINFGEIIKGPGIYELYSVSKNSSNLFRFKKEDYKFLLIAHNFFTKLKSYSARDINRLKICQSRIIECSKSHRINERDQLVNYVVALDALFGDAGDSIRYKVSMRGSAFLENDKLERSKVYEIISGAYGLRNKIVHGSDFKDEDLKALLPSLSSVTIKAFIKFAEYFVKHNKVITYKSLDDHLLNRQAF